MRRITDTLQEDQYIFLIISQSLLLTMRNVWKIIQEIKTQILCSVTFPRKQCRKVEKYGTSGKAADDNITQHMRIAFSISRDANIHSESVIRVVF